MLVKFTETMKVASLANNYKTTIGSITTTYYTNGQLTIVHNYNKFNKKLVNGTLIDALANYPLKATSYITDLSKINVQCITNTPGTEVIYDWIYKNRPYRHKK